jgi:RHS repeat-associated protein
VYLPTPSGPMPVAFYNGSKHYAVQTDHLNTPRRLTNSSKQVAWQWAFSAFGDEQPTTGKNRYVDPATTPNAGSTTVADVTFNLRYPGQYFDKESGLSYNYFRSYDARTGRYSQSDPIDLAGGWNKFAYAEQNPLSYVDRDGRLAQAIPGLIPVAIIGCALSSGCTGALGTAISSTADAIGDAIDSCVNAIDELATYSKGGKQNVRDSGLVGVTDEEIETKIKDPRTSAEEKKRLTKEQKARGSRNKQKRNN